MIQKVPNINTFLLESEESGIGNYTYDEMRSFLEKIVQLMDESPNDRLTKINIPNDMNSSVSVYDFKTNAVNKFDEFNKKYEKDNNVYYIWKCTTNINGIGINYLSPKRIDIDSILNFAGRYPGSILTLNIGFESQAEDKFANDMAAGKYGLLD